MTTPLPAFDEPSVVEVAISLQFKTLESLRTPQLGLLWSVFHDKGYSRLEERGELELHLRNAKEALFRKSASGSRRSMMLQLHRRFVAP